MVGIFRLRDCITQKKHADSINFPPSFTVTLTAVGGTNLGIWISHNFTSLYLSINSFKPFQSLLIFSTSSRWISDLAAEEALLSGPPFALFTDILNSRKGQKCKGV